MATIEENWETLAGKLWDAMGEYVTTPCTDMSPEELVTTANVRKLHRSWSELSKERRRAYAELPEFSHLLGHLVQVQGAVQQMTDTQIRTLFAGSN